MPHLRKLWPSLLLWRIWEARNDIRNGEVMSHPHMLFEKIKTYMEMIMLYSINPDPLVSPVLQFLSGLHRRRIG